MIFATNNKGKLQEIRKILNEYEIKSLKDINLDIEIIENKETFYENASKKAQEIYKIVKTPVIADDSGLCIEILDNWPGVLTHRFLGDNTTDRERNLAIIEKLKDVEFKKRKASVICNLVYYDGNKELVGEGVINGYIATTPCGNNGFGFDEIFMLENGKTLAELSVNEKNKISARYLAALELKTKLSF